MIEDTQSDFSEGVKLKCLLWSDRHCCVCGKRCRLDIEIAHINEKLKGSKRNCLDNAIPVCYHCHADMGRYFAGHPKGLKLRYAELKKRREQIYEKYTRDFVPGILPIIHPRQGEKGIELPRVGFSIVLTERFIPITAKIGVEVFLGGKSLGEIEDKKKPYYSRGISWSLNPGLVFHGNFSLPTECVQKKDKDLMLEINITAIDPYDREHKLLPVCFTYARKEKREDEYWYMEPTSFAELTHYSNEI